MQNNNKQVLSNILCQLMEQHALSVKDLHEKTGLAISTIQRIRTAKSNATIENLEIIARFFNISLVELLSNTINHTSKSTADVITKLPLISWSSTLNLHNKKILRMVSTSVAVSQEAFALKLYETINHLFVRGNIILIDPNEIPKNKSYVLVYKIGSELPVIQQLMTHHDKKILMPLSSLFQPEDLTDNFKIIGRIIQIQLNLREELVNDE